MCKYFKNRKQTKVEASFITSSVYYIHKTGRADVVAGDSNIHIFHRQTHRWTTREAVHISPLANRKKKYKKDHKQHLNLL